jgi:DNA-binding PadR family transcriptional regulator
MMREGEHAIWSASASQWYAEPKRLAELGLLHAERTPGRTHDRTHYTLTDAGRAALRDWLAEPSAFTRIQSEPIVRLLAAEYVEPEVLERSLEALREPIAESYAALDRAEALARERPGWTRPRPSSGVQQPGVDDRVERRRLVELLVGRDEVAEQRIGGAELEDQVGQIGQQVAARRVGRGRVERRGHGLMVRRPARSHKRLRQGRDICR